MPDTLVPSGRLGRLLRWFKSVQVLAEGVAKGIIIVAMLGSMVAFGFLADPAFKGQAIPFADRILVWSFVVFAVGLAELFVLFVVLAVLGKVDLPSAFYEKDPDVSASEEAATIDATRSAEAGSASSDPGQAALDDNTTTSSGTSTESAAVKIAAGAAVGAVSEEGSPGAAGTTSREATKVEVQVKRKSRPKPAIPVVSLSRLQAFMWTLVVMTIYFHRVVKDDGNGLPTIPAELLMVMGISGATYLISKNIASSAPASKKSARTEGGASNAGRVG